MTEPAAKPKKATRKAPAKKKEAPVEVPRQEQKQYICHKRVHAEPMTRGNYNTLRGWSIPEDENPEDPGYLVVYSKGSTREYVSWSPAAVFDEGYTKVQEVI